MSQRAFILVFSGAALATSVACSSGSGNESSSHSTSNEGTGASPGYAGATGSDVPLLSGDASVGYRERDAGTPTAVDAACAAAVLEPEAVKEDHTVEQKINCTADVPEPIAIYIMLDNSGSMKDNQKWTNAVAAINRFVKTDPSQGSAWKCVDEAGKAVVAPASLKPPGTGAISVAIQYFHPVNAASQNECDGSAHSTPAVPLGALPGNAASISSSLSGTKPNGNTPTVGALLGGTKYCTDFEAANPDKKCALVLVTDGQPNGCGLSSKCTDGSGSDCVDPGSLDALRPIVSKAHDDPTHSVDTFTVGMNGVTPDGFDLLDALAIAGGADCTPNQPGHETCDVTSSGADGLLAALDTIRKSVQVTSTSNQSVTTTSTVTTTLACEWSIPKPTDGQTFDQTRVNVSYTLGGVATQLGNVPGKADCASASGGWYYDDDAAPTRILACPDTCKVIQNSADVAVRVLVGCSTKTAIIR